MWWDILCCPRLSTVPWGLEREAFAAILHLLCCSSKSALSFRSFVREFLALPWQKVSYDPGLGFVCFFVSTSPLGGYFSVLFLPSQWVFTCTLSVTELATLSPVA